LPLHPGYDNRMTTRREFTLAALAWTTTGCGYRGEATFRGRFGSHSPDGERGVRTAEENTLRIDAANGLLDAEVLASFKRQCPGIRIIYRRATSRRLNDTFLREVSAGNSTTDILISSAMDLQFKLVNDGFAQAYDSPQKPHLPDWAVWNDAAYAISADPLVFAYNRALMPPADVPVSHDELVDLLWRKPDEYRGKITSYDPERSSTGYLYYTQDLLLSRDTLDLVRAVGRTQPQFYVSGGEVMDKLASGEHLFAYNMANFYLRERQLVDANIKVVFPSDYTLMMSRIAIIPKTARNPAASRLFLDFLLSVQGQAFMARRYMQPIRRGMPANGPEPSPEVVRRIHFGPSLLANLDEFRRRHVLREWRRALQA